MDIDPWPPAQAELAPGPQLLAIDTNVLINRLALVQALHKRLLASEVWLFVPHVVVRELDHQKSSPRPDLRHAAQSASAWLRDVLKSARHTRIRVRLESLLEFRSAQGVYEPGVEVKNDERILKSLTHAYSVGLLLDSAPDGSCAGTMLGGGGKIGGMGNVRLWTEDVNFSLMAEAAGLSTLGKCVTLSSVLGGLGLEDQDEGMELDLDPIPGVDLFSRQAVQPGLQAPIQPDAFSPYSSTSHASSTPTLHACSSASRPSRTTPGTPHGQGQEGAMPPPGTLAEAVARLQSQCPASLRPALLTALTLFAARRALPLSIPPLPPVSPSSLSVPLPPAPAPPSSNNSANSSNDTANSSGPPASTGPPSKRPGMTEEVAEKYFTATHSAVQHLISAIDASSLPIRQRAIQSSALRTLLKFVGPRHKGERTLRGDEVREMFGVLDAGTGDFRGVLGCLETLDP